MSLLRKVAHLSLGLSDWMQQGANDHWGVVSLCCKQRKRCFIGRKTLFFHFYFLILNS